MTPGGPAATSSGSIVHLQYDNSDMVKERTTGKLAAALFLFVSTMFGSRNEMPQPWISSSDPDSLGSDYIVEFHYQNDNFIGGSFINSLMNDDFFAERDDLVTAAFLLNVFHRRSHNVSSWHGGLFILTDRDRSLRTDLIQLQWMTYDRRTHPSWRWGIGLFGVGDFAGSRIQNAYHRLSEIKDVTLPYVFATRAGISVTGALQLPLKQYDPFDVMFLSDLLIASGTIPSVFRNAFSISLQYPTMSLETVFGYGYRTGIHSDLTSIFGESWFISFNGSVRLSASWNVRWWYSDGLYGIPQTTHVGIGFIWSSRENLINPMVHRFLP